MSTPIFNLHPVNILLTTGTTITTHPSHPSIHLSIFAGLNDNASYSGFTEFAHLVRSKNDRKVHRIQRGVILWVGGRSSITFDKCFLVETTKGFHPLCENIFVFPSHLCC